MWRIKAERLPRGKTCARTVDAHALSVPAGTRLHASRAHTCRSGQGPDPRCASCTTTDNSDARSSPCEWAGLTIHPLDGTDALASIAGKACIARVRRPRIDGVNGRIGVLGIAGTRRDGDAALEILRKRVIENLSMTRTRQCRGSK